MDYVCIINVSCLVSLSSHIIGLHLTLLLHTYIPIHFCGYNIPIHLYQVIFYHKQQILCGTKLSQFTSYVGKTVVVLLNYNTYLNEPLKLVEKTFAFCQKSTKTTKVLYRG